MLAVNMILVIPLKLFVLYNFALLCRNILFLVHLIQFVSSGRFPPFQQEVQNSFPAGSVGPLQFTSTLLY